jgi:hypothetical protein
MDRNSDRSLAPDELALHIIHRADRNGDEKLTLEEYSQASQEHGPKLFGPPDNEGYRPGGPFPGPRPGPPGPR